MSGRRVVVITGGTAGVGRRCASSHKPAMTWPSWRGVPRGCALPSPTWNMPAGVGLRYRPTSPTLPLRGARRIRSKRNELRHEKSNVRVCMAQLPGLNTPQFTWNLNRMPEHPMPVPPIFQPELAARAIRFLAEHPRRNMWVGVSTAYTILGERLAPRLLDLYLGRKGVGSQQTGDDAPRLGSNLFTPRDDDSDRGARGPFDDQAHTHDPQLALSLHRRSALSALAGAAALTASLLVHRRGSRHGA